MKIGIVGAGEVGTACLFAMALRGSADEIVLINRDARRAEGTVSDLRYGALLGPHVEVRAGTYDDLHGCSVVAITAGVNERKGGATDRSDPAGRLLLLGKNAEVYRDIVPRIVASAADAILLVVTDPPDPLADLARNIAGHSRVLSTGTFLDSLRFRFHLGQRIGMDPRSIEAQVLGEHGTSQVYAWSSARVGGAAILPAMVPRGTDVAKFQRDVEEQVRYANINIVEGTGASRLGIGTVVARINEMIGRDEHAVVPIGSWHERFGATLSLPCVVGRKGVERVLTPDLAASERAALDRSAEVLRSSLESIGLRE